MWSVGFIALALAATQPCNASPRCAISLEQRGPDKSYAANSIQITGGVMHPIEEILLRLGITEGSLKSWSGEKVLSVGEGFSELLPRARAIGVDMWGVDPAYPLPGERSEEVSSHLPAADSVIARYQLEGLQSFVERYRPVLVKGLGENLPFADQSFDRVVSHRLVNNLSNRRDEIVPIVNEALRVAKNEVRIEGFWDMASMEAVIKESAGKGWVADAKVVTVPISLQVYPPSVRRSGLIVFSRPKQ